MRNPFRCFNSSPEVIRLTVMLYVRYPLSLRQVEDLLFERGIGICHETVRFWWNRFGPSGANWRPKDQPPWDVWRPVRIKLTAPADLVEPTPSCFLLIAFTKVNRYGRARTFLEEPSIP